MCKRKGEIEGFRKRHRWVDKAALISFIVAITVSKRYETRGAGCMARVVHM